MIRPFRLATTVVVSVVAIGFLYFAVTLGQVWWASRQDHARPAQAIVVLGAAQYNGRPSAVLRARLDHALDLWRRKLAPVIVVTGGRQPGDRVTEAAAAAEYLLGKGVPDASILREVSGTSSWQSLASAAAFLKARGIVEVLLVSDPFHALRIGGIAGELNLHAHTSPTRTSPIRGFDALVRMGREAVAVSIARIVGYRTEAGVHRVVARAAPG